ncbi:MAG TPA: hypothetical protein VNX47_01885 [Nevskia sp.]|nr:hypothetical protein [Nevskia sp.]
MEMGIGHKSAERVQDAMPQLARCGFQPFGTATQGSGNTGRALSADGMTWAELVELRSGLGGSLRQLLGKGVLRGAGCTAQFTSEFNNGDYLVTTTAPLEAADGVDLEQLSMDTPIAALALRHMQRIEAALLRRHPLKLRILCGAGDVSRAERRLRSRDVTPVAPVRPLSVAELHELGVPEHLARIIAGDCADIAELPH